MNKPFPHSTAARSPVGGKASVPVPAFNGTEAPPKQPCLSCQGEGEAEWLALDETAPRWLICDDCDGTGLATKPYCEICQGKLTVDHFCYDCDSYADGWNKHSFIAGIVTVDGDGVARVAY